MEIKRSEARTSRDGREDYFTGAVKIDDLFRLEGPTATEAVWVTFQPGARTAWHTHPLGQAIIVTDGRGRAQRWGGPVEEIGPGDVVWFAPGEKHWHGAGPTTSMSHIAIHEKLDGSYATWQEKVSDNG